MAIPNLVLEEGKRRPWKPGCEIPRRILHGFLPFDMCKLNSALGHFEKLKAACKSIKLVQFCYMTVIAALSKYSHGYFLEQHNPKIQQIQDIWAAGLGVVSLHIFQSVIPVEAYTREACMIDALGEFILCLLLIDKRRFTAQGFCTLKLSCIYQSACFVFFRAFEAHQQEKRRLLWESCIMESEEKKRDGSVPLETSAQDPFEWRREAVAAKWLKSSFILVHRGRKALLDAIGSCIFVWKALSL